MIDFGSVIAVAWARNFNADDVLNALVFDLCPVCEGEEESYVLVTHTYCMCEHSPTMAKLLHVGAAVMRAPRTVRLRVESEDFQTKEDAWHGGWHAGWDDCIRHLQSLKVPTENDNGKV